ncbi:solute carrier family 22 member 3-like [Tetranychus urticae]|uniref:solute carrier family 22 member 3-like n=1 Tax=Tetranychus urticae TaxID=32264 RepID=UPI00077B9261|nr:solute carrier family 22 member 3-like [Tetranychus urticae]
MAPKVDFWCATDLQKNMTDHCYADIKKTIPCTKWVYAESFLTKTIISEWDLVCDRAWLVSITQSLYMCGMTISALLCGHFSDKYGRLPVLWTAVVTEIVAGLSCAFSISIYQYMISRFVLAIGAYGRYLTGFMLVIETTGPEYRATMGIVCRFGWALGCFILPGIVWLFDNWRHAQLAFTLPEILWILWLCRIPESPRWQLAKGNSEKAQEELRRAAELNKRRLTGIEDKLEELRDRFEKTIDKSCDHLIATNL